MMSSRNSKLTLSSKIALCLLACSVSQASAAYTAYILGPSGDLTATLGTGTASTTQVGYGYSTATSTNHALRWDSFTRTDLQPTDPLFVNSQANGVAGTGPSTQIVGQAMDTSGLNHAIVWDAANTPTDLTPSTYDHSAALASNGTTQVGYANQQAALWTGPAASVVSLHPADTISNTPFTSFLTSQARAITADSSAQAGVAFDDSFQVNHAIFWTGTAASALDLDPSTDPFIESEANGIASDGSGGYNVAGLVRYPTDNAHAGTYAEVWHITGTSFTATELAIPAGFGFTQATGIAGNLIVGHGNAADGREHALLWDPTLGTVTDLNTLVTNLNSDYTDTFATGIDAQGNIIGFANYDPSHVGLSLTQHAVVWVPDTIPEPTTLLLLTPALAFLQKRRKTTTV